MRELLTRAQAAKILGISIATANRMSYDGRLPVVRISPRVVRVDTNALEAMIAEKSERR